MATTKEELKQQKDDLMQFGKDKGWTQLAPLTLIKSSHNNFKNGLFQILQHHSIDVDALCKYKLDRTYTTTSPLTKEWDAAIARQLQFRLQSTPYEDRLNRTKDGSIQSGTETFFYLWEVINPTTEHNSQLALCDFNSVMSIMPVDPTPWFIWETQARLMAGAFRATNMAGGAQMMRLGLINGMPDDSQSGFEREKHDAIRETSMDFDTILERIRQFQQRREQMMVQRKVNGHTTAPSDGRGAMTLINTPPPTPDRMDTVITLLTTLLTAQLTVPSGKTANVKGGATPRRGLNWTGWIGCRKCKGDHLAQQCPNVTPQTICPRCLRTNHAVTACRSPATKEWLLKHPNEPVILAFDCYFFVPEEKSINPIILDEPPTKLQVTLQHLVQNHKGTVPLFNQYVVAIDSAAGLSAVPHVGTLVPSSVKQCNTSTLAAGGPTTIDTQGVYRGCMMDSTSTTRSGIIELKANVLPFLPLPLISVSQLTSLGFTIHLEHQSHIHTPSGVKIPLTLVHGIYTVIFKDLYTTETLLSEVKDNGEETVTAVTIPIAVAHARLGHQPYDKVTQLAKDYLRVTVDDSDQPPSCMVCTEAALHATKTTSGPAADKSEFHNHVFWTDGSGPKAKSTLGNVYERVWVEDKSSDCIMTYHSNKTADTTLDGLYKLKAEVWGASKPPTGVLLRMDSEGAYLSTGFLDQLKEWGWTYKLAPSGEHQYHGKAERAIGISKTGTAKLLYGSRLGTQYWDYASRAFNWTRRRLPFSDGTPPSLEQVGRRDDTMELVRAFGCLMAYRAINTNKGNYESLAKLGINLGLSSLHSFGTYSIFDLDSKRVIHSRSVVAFEEIKPATHETSAYYFEQLRNGPTNRLAELTTKWAMELGWPIVETTTSTIPTLQNYYKDLAYADDSSDSEDEEDPTPKLIVPATINPTTGGATGARATGGGTPSVATTILGNTNVGSTSLGGVGSGGASLGGGGSGGASLGGVITPGTQMNVTTTRIGRVSKKPPTFQIQNGPQLQTAAMKASERTGKQAAKTWLAQTSKQTSKPTLLATAPTDRVDEPINKDNFITIQEVNMDMITLVLAEISDSNEENKVTHIYVPEGRDVPIPKNRNDLLRMTPEDQRLWRLSRREEQEGFLEKKALSELTYEQVLKYNTKPIPMMEVYDIKDPDERGRRRMKTRWCVQGNRDPNKGEVKEGDVIFPSPTALPLATRAVVIKALHDGDDIFCFDIGQAFLHHQIYDKDVIVCWLDDEGLMHFYLLMVAVYGLADSSGRWNTTLTGDLIEFGMRVCPWDRATFTNDKGMNITVHVDDGLITCRNRPEELIAHLEHKYGTKNVKVNCMNDKTTRFLGMDWTINNKEKTCKISQKESIIELLTRTNMLDCRPVKTPVPLHTQLPQQLEDGINPEYSSIVGSIGWLVNHTRPEMAHAYQELSRHIQKNGREHWLFLTHVLRYLSYTKDWCLTITGRIDLKLDLWTDASYAECVITRKSTTGAVVVLGGSLLQAKSRLQPSVATSSCEAELYARFEGVMMITQCKRIVEFIGIKVDGPIRSFTDSKSSMDMLKRQTPDKRSKHVDMRFFRIKEAEDEGLTKQHYEPTGTMVADILTKSLGTIRHRVLSYAMLNGLMLPGLEEVCLSFDKAVIDQSELRINKK